MNHVIEKGKPRYKLPNRLFKEQDRYDKFLDKYPFTTLSQFKDFLGRIQNCDTYIVMFIFDSNIPFLISPTWYNIY